MTGIEENKNHLELFSSGKSAGCINPGSVGKFHVVIYISADW